MRCSNKIIILVFSIVLALAGCQSSSAKIHIRFDDAQGLLKGDRVISGGKAIGKVSKVSYTSEGKFLVDIMVADQYKDRLTENAKFYVIDDPEMSGKRAVEVVQGASPGPVLADGATVVGSSRAEDLINDMVAGMQRGLGELEAQAQELLDSLKKLPEKEEIRRLREELERIGKELKKSGKSAREKFEREVLPKIEEEIERLKEMLKKRGREKEVEPLEVDLKELKKI